MTTSQQQRPTRPTEAHLTQAVTPDTQQAPTKATETVDNSPNPSIPAADWNPTFERLTALPNQISTLVEQYSSQLKLVAVLVAALVVMRLALAILEAINGIPLMQPFLELVGLGYLGWFAIQHLLTADSRQSLSQTLNGWKAQLLGR